MQARGIPRDKARRLVVNGFFNSLLERIEDTVVRAHLSTLLAKRLSVA
jgi:Fe-S cluster assembly scaffold protein SufB